MSSSRTRKRNPAHIFHSLLPSSSNFKIPQRCFLVFFCYNNTSITEGGGSEVRGRRILLFWRMLTYANVCWRMLTYAEVWCGQADIANQALVHVLFRCYIHNIYVCLYVCMFVCMYVCVYIYMYIYIYIYMYICIYMCVCVCVCIYIYLWFVCIYMYIYTYM